MPPGIALALSVVRMLIAYACHIARKAEECAVRGDISPVTINFGKGIAIDQLIIRVARGLRRALMLQEMLEQCATTGRDLAPVARRESGPSGGSRRGGQDKDKPPHVERLPSVAEIAAELERKPLGVVVADICHDIGIVPSDLTEEQWDALQTVILTYGGTTGRLWPAMKHNMEAQMERVMLDPKNAPRPYIPLVPWTRWLRFVGAPEVRPAEPA